MFIVSERKTATAGQTTFRLNKIGQVDSTCQVYVNNVEQTTGYTITIPDLVFNVGLNDGDEVIVTQSNYFYHGVIRRVSAVFGTLFNNIHVKLRDTDNSVLKSIKVPISYGHWQKYIAHRDQRNSLDADLDGSDGYIATRMTLPRMSFELTGINYDPQRQLNSYNKQVECTEPDNADTSKKWMYERSPFKAEFSLYIQTKKFDEGLQIVEQIVPYFTPSFVVPVKTIDTMSIAEDIKFTLESINPEITYEGGFDEVNSIMWTLTFVADLSLYKPVMSDAIIKSALIDFQAVGSDYPFVGLLP